MPHSLWLDGIRLGTMDFGASAVLGRHMAVLQPTVHGLALLPRVTAFVPAMYEYNALCSARGVDDAFAGEDEGMAMLEELEHTAPVRRMHAAFEQIKQLEVRDARGAVVPWSHILVTDLRELRALARPADGSGTTDAPPETRDEPNGEATDCFVVSVTFAQGRDRAPSLGDHRRRPATPMVS